MIVGDEGAAFAGCGGDSEIISAILDPIYGNAAVGCNASDSYRWAWRSLCCQISTPDPSPSCLSCQALPHAVAAAVEAIMACAAGALQDHGSGLLGAA